jgi:hypothetical protein
MKQMSSPMTPERFIEIVEAYGAAPNRWPDDERLAALAMMTDERCAQTLRWATELDQELDAAASPRLETSSFLVGQIVGAFPQSAPLARWRPLLWPAAAMAACVAAGIAIGAQLPPSGSTVALTGEYVDQLWNDDIPPGQGAPL